MSSKNLDEKIDSNIYFLSKMKILKDKRKDEILLLETKVNRLRSDFDEDFSMTMFLYIIGSAVFLVIFLFMLNNDIYINKSNRQKIKKELKEIPCQSCGVLLKFSLLPFIEAEFCNNCYDGEKFREPDLTYETMLKRIEENLKEQKLSKKQIKGYLSKVGKLNRWVRTVRWKN